MPADGTKQLLSFLLLLRAATPFIAMQVGVIWESSTPSKAEIKRIVDCMEETVRVDDVFFSTGHTTRVVSAQVKVQPQSLPPAVCLPCSYPVMLLLPWLPAGCVEIVWTGC